MRLFVCLFVNQPAGLTNEVSYQLALFFVTRNKFNECQFFSIK